MNGQALATTAPAITRETLTQRFRRYISRGWTPYVAAEAAVRELCEEGYRDALLLEVLPSMLYAAWEEEHPARPSLVTPGKAAGPANEARRIDVGVLKRSSSLMESLFELDGLWVRIGDMDRSACHRAAAQQKRAALKRAHYARFFHAVSERIPDGSSVREKLREPELARLFDEANPVGPNHP